MSVSTGWTRGASSAYAYGTWTRAARTGISLTRTSVYVDGLAIPH